MSEEEERNSQCEAYDTTRQKFKKNVQGNVRREEEDNRQYEATGAHVNSTGAPLPPPGPACPVAYLLGPRRRYVYPCIYIYIHTHTHTHITIYVRVIIYT